MRVGTKRVRDLGCTTVLAVVLRVFADLLMSTLLHVHLFSPPRWCRALSSACRQSLTHVDFASVYISHALTQARC